MFKFDFNIEDPDHEFDAITPIQPEDPAPMFQPSEAEFRVHSIRDLLDTLPSQISFSLVSPTSNVKLYKRDLFDARFQLMSDSQLDNGVTSTEQINGSIYDRNEAPSALEIIDAPSDLIPGVYEGGFRVWECSLDLVEYLESLKSNEKLSDHLLGRKIIEIGCGTAMPTIYLFQQILNLASVSSSAEEITEVHLQDYNASVLELVTVPNLLLAWYTSPTSTEYLQANPEDVPTDTASDSSELQITPELKQAFLDSLEAHKIRITFYSGPWQSLTAHLQRSSKDEGSSISKLYDIILTSETIYQMDSLGSLVELLDVTAGGSTSTDSTRSFVDNLPAKCSKLSLDPTTNPEQAGVHFPLCLVAAKVLYFGVGGGISEFVKRLESLPECGKRRGQTTTVWEKNVGVGRRILRVNWEGH